MDCMKSEIKSLLDDTIVSLENTFSSNDRLDVIQSSAQLVIECLKNNGKVLVCGNGGSAADAQHFAAELVGRYKLERHSYPSIALTTDTSILTAIGNDYGYDQVFSRQVEGLGNNGDVLIAISTSGNSENVLKAIDVAHNKGIKVIGLSGKGGGKLAEVSDCSFVCPSSNTPHIQASHIMTLHVICEIVEKSL